MTLKVSRADWNARAERLIAFLRLVLAGGSLLVIWLDPTQPSRHWHVAYAWLILYLLYSAAVFQMVRGRPRPWLPVVTQTMDLLWVVPIIYFTEGANTPFFPFFVTFMLNAGIRWGGWGSWAVTAYSVAVYGSLLFVETPTELNLNNDLMRLGYFLIVGALGGHLAEYRRQREAELRLLRDASEVVASRYRAVNATQALIELANSTGLADAVLGVLRAPGDDDVLLIRGVDVMRLGIDEAAPFLAAARSQGDGIAGSRAVRLTESAAMILRFAEAESGLAYPIRAGTELVGAIFFFVRAPHTLRHASAEFLGLLLRHVIPQLETLYVLERARRVEVAEERRRIARDLHDSFIQVLAALGLRLDAVSARRDADVEGLKEEVAQMHEVVSRELLRVRAYLAEMREPLHDVGTFAEMVRSTTESFRSRTEIPVDVSISAGLSEIPAAAVRELTPLLREALTNVEKHARASRVKVSASIEAQGLVLVIRDDGVGISEGETAGQKLMEGHGQGLYSMRERARLLGGSLTVRRPGHGGTVVSVSVPLPLFV